ncbi:hypothetical protein NA63_2148 [Flavobacteriaceae bacterium MAR_2010_105]|nr:hypothetical protein NA63_2148 [Flavobacteriaceae bacterium MAR_2010_105]
MHSIKQQFVFKLSALLLVLALTAPSVVKFGHIFDHHKHEVCHGELQSHIHTFDVDCNFYKFKLNNVFTFVNVNFNVPEFPKVNPTIYSKYSFLSQFQRLHFSLRGPPLNDLA